MIQLYNQQIERFRLGECNRFRASGKVHWKLNSYHKVKSDIYGPAKAHAKIVRIEPASDNDVILFLEKVTVFEYLKARRPGWEGIKRVKSGE